MVSVIVSKKVHMDMCPALNGYGDISIERKIQVIRISILKDKNKGKKLKQSHNTPIEAQGVEEV
jgi:hypothetical protein